jgi:pyochelin biosynthesis protein PchC
VSAERLEVPTDVERWFLGGRKRIRRDTQLLCLPHAGGSASSYLRWLRPVDDVVDLIPVQLPGRENRVAEEPYTDQPALIAALADVVRHAGLGDVALFGHSMGAVLAINLCRALEDVGFPVRHLFLSGHGGPAQRPVAGFENPSDEVMLSALGQVGAPNHQWLKDHPEVRDMVLRTMRADLGVVLTGTVAGPPVHTPITVLNGIDDPTPAGEDGSGWFSVTTAQCVVHRLPGDHFYLTGQGDAVARIIGSALRGAEGSDA